jgi:hypothetical protein
MILRKESCCLCNATVNLGSLHGVLPFRFAPQQGKPTGEEGQPQKSLDPVDSILDNLAMQNRRPAIVAIFVPILVGSIGLIHLMSQPRFESIRTVDVVQLLGSGLCFGIALTALFAMIRNRNGE